MADKDKIDGNNSFLGGMDTSRPPCYVANDKYQIGINTWIANSPDGVKNRPGLREIKLYFNSDLEESIYRNGNIQAGDWYNDGERNVLIRCVDGYIFKFYNISAYAKKGFIINSGIRNNPQNTRAWITRIPKGAIISDGESACTLSTIDTTRRTNPKAKEIGACRMGVYLQNRLFIVDSTGERIIASTFGQPASISEALANNLYGFASPDDSREFTALGKERILIDTALTGHLSFSTNSNVYRVDVRGAMADWGKVNGFKTGSISDSVPEIGAVSHNSYLTVNSNLYFRNKDFGLMSIKQSQYQFNNQDAYASHSLEASLFLDNDTDILLDKCYSKRFKDKILTTIGPQLRGKNTYWSALVVYSPDIFFSQNQVLNRTWDGVITGVRPWCITSVDSNGYKEFVIDSFDHDEVNRMYVLDDSINYDWTIKDGKREIESKLYTRSYEFNAPQYLKTPIAAFYSISGIEKTTKVLIKSREEESGPYQEIWCTEHHNRFQNGADSRNSVQIDDKFKNAFNLRQDLFNIKGSFNIKRWLREASLQERKNSSHREPSDVNLANNQCSLFDYKLYE